MFKVFGIQSLGLKWALECSTIQLALKLNKFIVPQVVTRQKPPKLRAEAVPAQIVAVEEEDEGDFMGIFGDLWLI